MYSRYNVYLENYPKDSYVTIYNLFSKKYVCVHQKVLKGNVSKQLKDKMLEYGIIFEDKNTIDESQRVVNEFLKTTNFSEELVVMV